jgi:hypothetical protein
MTGQELKAAAIKLFGERGWVSSLAEHLGVDRTQVWRYVNGRVDVPGPVAAAVQCWLRSAKPPMRG